MPKSLTSEWYTADLRRWILEKGRFAGDLDELIAETGIRLVEAGAPLWRIRFSFRTLHPLVAAVSSVWEREAVSVEQRVATHGMESRPGYVGSPMEIVGRTGEPFRKRLENDLTEDDHSVLHEMKNRGATDYFITPIRFREARRPMFVFASDNPGGFSQYDIDSFSDLATRLAPLLEVFGLERKIAAIAAAYLGERTGKRVLEGQIVRGDVERIQAAILISDMRGWTSLSRQLPAKDALAVANRYFEILTDAIEENEGEVLKFMGDGILAIFPTGDEADNGSLACQRAASAARVAINASSELAETAGVTFGIGLHFGDVLYGNIGSRTRLDFTVMGEAVNLAARFEGLCEAIGHPVLFTQAVAERLRDEFLLLGSENLKGYTEPFDVYGWK